MRFLPQSLFGRLLLFLTGGLTIAQLLSAAVAGKLGIQSTMVPMSGESGGIAA